MDLSVSAVACALASGWGKLVESVGRVESVGGRRGRLVARMVRGECLAAQRRERATAPLLKF